jgi:hypothetical protein
MTSVAAGTPAATSDPLAGEPRAVVRVPDRG